MQVSWESAAAGAIVPSATGFWLWMQARANGKKDAVSGQAAMIKAAQDAATQVISALQAEITSLRQDATEDRERIAALEASLAKEKQARTIERHDLADVATKAKAEAMLATRRADEAERLAAEAAGERRLLQQRIDSLLRWLAAQGLDAPQPPPRSTEPILLGPPST